MIIKGNRRGGAKQLADHLLRRDTNENVVVKEFAGFPTMSLNDLSLRKALKLMLAQGQAKGKLRTLYHAIIAPQEGEVLDGEQLAHTVETLTKNLGLEAHQYVIVEHRKSGRQHFHVVFNILHPEHGKQARLQWTKKIEYKTSRQVEAELGLKPVSPKGKAVRRWEAQRGKRNGVDAVQVRKTVSAIYRTSKSGAEFVANLAKADFVLTAGQNGSYVLVDTAGDTHGLMRRIEGAKLKDLKQRFPDLKDMSLPSLEMAVKRQTTRKSTTNHLLQTASSLLRRAGENIRKVRLASTARELMNFMRAAAALIFSRRKPQMTKDFEPPRIEMPPVQEDNAELLQWAFENGRLDLLDQLGIEVPPDFDL